jgi:amino acid adenylation domain-containing protein
MNTLCDYLTTAARTYADHAAVRYKHQSISYASLDQMSSALATRLMQAGVRPGERVGIWLNKSIEAIVSIYAILKAGAAYVPLDPIAPVKRATYMLSDCQVRCLITTQERLALLDESFLQSLRPALLVLADRAINRPSLAGIPLLAWPEALGASPHSDSDQAHVASPDQLAYILYTSGSTGSPKGVMLSHRNGRVFVDWARRRFRLAATDRLSSHAPFHFDLSILDIFGAASAGATLVLVPENQQSLGVGLVRLMIEEGISVWYSVPTALIRVLEAPNSMLLATSRLRVVLFAGEVFPLKHLRRLRAALPGVQLYNLYGPTETNVCTFYQVTDDDVAPARSQPVPIGQACDYATTFTVDDSGMPTDLTGNAEGELCVGGNSLMLGYWGDPIKTAQRLIPCPQSLASGEYAYRTGDIVRRDGGGRYLFVGRRDHMVKSRGYRIELGEIEAALLSHEGVHEAAVIAIPDTEIGAQLESYIVPRHGVELVESDLRQHCLHMLPRYMLPERFHVLQALPHTSTGKIDRQALTASSEVQTQEISLHAGADRVV